MSGHDPRGRIDFERVARAALGNAEQIVCALLPDGRRDGAEWIARNPHRSDRALGSFKANLLTGLWCDFATGDRGRDIVGLVAFVSGCDQRTAAIELAQALGINPFVGGPS